MQLASVGVALSIFGTITKLLNIPLLSVTTNVVATAVGSDAGVPSLQRLSHAHCCFKSISLMGAIDCR